MFAMMLQCDSVVIVILLGNGYSYHPETFRLAVAVGSCCLIHQVAAPTMWYGTRCKGCCELAPLVYNDIIYVL